MFRIEAFTTLLRATSGPIPLKSPIVMAMIGFMRQIPPKSESAGRVQLIIALLAFINKRELLMEMVVFPDFLRNRIRLEVALDGGGWPVQDVGFSPIGLESVSLAKS